MTKLTEAGGPFASVVERNLVKSQFLHRQKETWERLIKEVEDHKGRAAEARKDAKRAEGSFLALAERSRKDEEAAALVRKERDELLRDAAHLCAYRAAAEQWTRDLLAQAEAEKKSKEEAAAASAALAVDLGQARAQIQTLEAEVERRRKERDELKTTVNDLSDKLAVAEGDFAVVKSHLEAVNAEHVSLSGVVGIVCDQLQVAQPEHTSTLTARAARITDCVHELEVDALRLGVNRAFTVARSHYEEGIDLDHLSLGYADGWAENELDELEAVVEPLSRRLADNFADAVLPRRD